MLGLERFLKKKKRYSQEHARLARKYKLDIGHASDTRYLIHGVFKKDGFKVTVEFKLFDGKFMIEAYPKLSTKDNGFNSRIMSYLGVQFRDQRLLFSSLSGQRIPTNRNADFFDLDKEETWLWFADIVKAAQDKAVFVSEGKMNGKGPSLSFMYNNPIVKKRG